MNSCDESDERLEVQGDRWTRLKSHGTQDNFYHIKAISFLSGAFYMVENIFHI